jgi:HSP20 family molecular chaperone IbpA
MKVKISGDRYFPGPNPWFPPPPPLPDFGELFNDMTKITFAYSSFTCEVKDGVATCRCDVPGLRPEDANLFVSDGHLWVTGKRFDTNVEISQCIKVDNIWDFDNAEANLQHGVLKVVLKQRVDLKPKSIKLNVR